MNGYFSLVLHAHLPFVRHPEHPRFLEESWLFEAITETYLPLLQLLRAWQADNLAAPVAITLTPTLCAMLRDPLLRDRCARRLDGLIELAGRERVRTQWDPPHQALATFYRARLESLREIYRLWDGDLVAAFRRLQDDGRIEILTSAATHALLPLLAHHLPSVRGQVLTARDDYRACFGRDPEGFWLPECGYVDGLEPILKEAGLRWFVTDSHGLLHAHPRPRYALFAPLITPDNLVAFARDVDSARQVWSREAGYPGDPRYRDFYRDIGFDLDLDYLEPFLPAPALRGFTGLKYHRITGRDSAKEVYLRASALQAVEAHAAHFLEARQAQLQHLASIFDRPPLVVSPFDAELFGHWWYEGPEFLDAIVRKSCSCPGAFRFITPGEYLRRHPTHQVARPAASSWGEEGYWRVWLNEKNHWIYPHLNVAQERMTELVRRFPQPDPLQARALQAAARELLLAQSSDWPFILRTGTSPAYATARFKDHLLAFTRLYDQLNAGALDDAQLADRESRHNLFAPINPRHWA